MQPRFNNVKGGTPQDGLVSTTDSTDGTDSLVEEIDQKVSVGKGGRTEGGGMLGRRKSVT